MTKPTALLVLFAATLATSQAFGANECKVEYGYHTGSGTNRQDKTATENIDAGATETVNRSGMNYVKNLKNNKVRVTLAGAADNDFTLDKNQINPGVGFYLTAVQLKTLKCLAQASAPAFGSPEQMLAALKQANTAASEIAKQLKNTFNLAESQVAALLKGAGYSAAQVAAALKSAFNATGAQVAGWLKAAGYTGEQVAAALKSAFNASAQQAGGWLKTAFSATGAQIADWLQAAGYTGEQVAAALKSLFNSTATQTAQWLKAAFNANAQQLGQWLRGAGYTLIQVAQALDELNIEPAMAMAAIKQAFGASWNEIVNAYKNLVVALQPTNCGAAGCNQGAQVLKAAGATAEEALRVLRELYRLNVSGGEHIAKTIYGLSGQALDAALAAAGYVVTAANTAVAGAMELKYILIGDGFKTCDQYPNTRSYNPVPLPANGSPFVVTLLGNNALGAASAINEWPTGASYSIRERGRCYLVVQITVPTTAREGTSGRAVIMAGNRPGPAFGWRIGPLPSFQTLPQQPKPQLTTCPGGTRYDERSGRCV